MAEEYLTFLDFLIPNFLNLLAIFFMKTYFCKDFYIRMAKIVIFEYDRSFFTKDFRIRKKNNNMIPLILA